MRQFRRRSAAIGLIFAFALLDMLGYAWQLRASDSAAPPAQFATVVQIGTVSFQLLASNTPTATRTPTPINIGNFVWDDRDHDGRQDAGEPGIAGVTVQLWNAAKTQFLASTTTNANGAYTIIAPVPGNYRVRVLLPHPGLDSFSPKDQASGDDLLDSDINPSGTNLGFTDTLTLASNLISTTVVDAGIIIYRTPTPTRTPTPINIGNFVWDDYDHDGRQDAGEPGMAGVTVQLWNAAKTQLIASTTTNANGAYTIIAPLPGDYRVRVLLPNAALDSFSPKDQAGGDEMLDSDINQSGTNKGFTDVLTLATNLISTTVVDAGIIKYRTPTPTRTPTPINIGNFVWDDLDGDGRQDAGEPGLSGITVQLWNSATYTLYDEAVTDSAGHYTVIAPYPGNYRIRVLLTNSSHSFAPKDQAGGDDQLDSDINLTGAYAGYTDAFYLDNYVISITRIDAGVLTPLILQPAVSLVFEAQPIVTSTLQPVIDVNLCEGFRLTSPLDGMPNGVATFYWDPVRRDGISYQITVLDETGRALATYNGVQGTSLNGDVSRAVIGGEFRLLVRITALQNGRAICSDEHFILRAAPDPGQPPSVPGEPPPIPNTPVPPRATPTPRRGN